MADSEYSGLVGDYTKFMIVRIVVFVTVVVSIFSGTSEIEKFSVGKIDTIKAIRHVAHLSVDDEDEVIEIMFFGKQNKNDDPEEETATVEDSSLVNALIEAKYPGWSINDYNGGYSYRYDSLGSHPDTVAPKIRQYLASTLENSYARLKKVSDTVFNIKLSILSDISFDLRYWIFILPLLFSVAAIYSYILRFRIELLQLDEESGSGVTNVTARQYPYLYLRGLSELLNLILLILFLASIYSFVKNFPEVTRNYLFVFYSIIFYFSAVYLCTIHRKIFSSYADRKYLLVNKLWDKAITAVKRIVVFIRYNNLFRLGTIFLVLTLFLSMSYETCTQGNRKPDTIKGYKLVTDYKKSVWQYDDLGGSINRFYQWDYISCFLSAAVFFCFLLMASKKKPVPLFGAKLLLCYFSFNMIIFSVYFAFYDGLYTTQLIFYQSLFLLALWIRKNIPASLKKKDWDYSKLAGTLAVYCFPFMLLSAYRLYIHFKLVPGWSFLYAGILCFTIAYYFFITTWQSKQGTGK